MLLPKYWTPKPSIELKCSVEGAHRGEREDPDDDPGDHEGGAQFAPPEVVEDLDHGSGLPVLLALVPSPDCGRRRVDVVPQQTDPCVPQPAYPPYSAGR